MKAATGNFKRIGLELGGKNPNIVFADADLDVAVDYALNAAFFHAGQVCSAGSRLMIEHSIYDAFVAKLAERLPRIAIGNGFHAETQMGPVQSAQQHEKILRMVQAGVAEGARLVYGGKRPEGDVYRKGYWLQPTLLADVSADMNIAKEEIFGPVVTAERFHSEDDALRAANDTPYGLAAAVWTRDLDKANRMSRAALWHGLGERLPSVLSGSTVGRLQGQRHRPRTGAHRPGRVHRTETQLHQPRTEGDGVVRRLSAGVAHITHQEETAR